MKRKSWRSGSFSLPPVFSLLLVLVLGLSCSSPKPATTTLTDAGLVSGLSSNLSKNSGSTTFNIDKIENTSAPLFGNISVPVNLSSKDDLVVGGWAIDKPSNAPAGGVDIAIDGTPWRADLGQTRTDIVAATKNSALLYSGFRFHVRAGAIPKGEHSLTVRVISSDKSSYYESLPLKLVIE